MCWTVRWGGNHDKNDIDTIEEATHKRLQSHAVPLEDSYDTVINRALDALEPRKAPIDKQGIDQDIVIVDPNRLPNLTHTKILSASVNGMSISKPNWHKMRNKLIQIAMEQEKSLHWLRSKSRANIIEGRTKNSHYKYLDGYDISVDATNAPRSFQTVVNIAFALSIPVKMEVTEEQKRALNFATNLPC